MIPLIPSEPATPAGYAASRPGPLGDGAVARVFGDLMMAPDVSLADATLTANGAAAGVEVEEQDLVILPAAEAIAGDDQNVLASFRSDASKDAKSHADVTSVLPNGKESGSLSRMSALPPDAGPARAGTPAQTIGAEAANARSANAKPQLPSVAQTVLEGRLPQTAPSQGVQSQIAGEARNNRAALDAPPRSGVMPEAAKTVATSVNQAATPELAAGAAPEESGTRQRADPLRFAATAAASDPARSAFTQAQPPAVAIAQGAAGPEREVTEKKLTISDGGLIVSSAPAERQMAGTGAQGSASVTPETARNAATQIAAAITSSQGKTTEIVLNPEELGRVRLSLAVDDNAIVLNVVAERSETQDLLRRHMDQLAQEFRELGYASISFTFGEEKGEAQSEFTRSDETPEPEVHEVLAGPDIGAGQTTSGLDLRI